MKRIVQAVVKVGDSCPNCEQTVTEADILSGGCNNCDIFFREPIETKTMFYDYEFETDDLI